MKLLLNFEFRALLTQLRSSDLWLTKNQVGLTSENAKTFEKTAIILETNLETLVESVGRF